MKISNYFRNFVLGYVVVVKLVICNKTIEGRGSGDGNYDGNDDDNDDSEISQSECFNKSINGSYDGIDLICCGRNASLNGDCARLASTQYACHCQLNLLPNLKCRDWSKVQLIEVLSTQLNSMDEINNGSLNCWKIEGWHQHIEFSVHIQKWDIGDSVDLLNALSQLNLVSLVINFLPTEYSTEIPNLGVYFPSLRYLFLSAAKPTLNGNWVKLRSTSFLRDVWHLETLKIINLDFDFDEKEEAAWITSIQQVHIENSALSTLPWWFGRTIKLERLIIRHTMLTSALVISQISSIIQLELSNNRIGDLDKLSFNCVRVQQMDFSTNLITKFAYHTFAQCEQLKFLDLSQNLIIELPEKAFHTNTKLKTLRIDSTHISELKTEHFVGLKSLRSLSLSNNPLRVIDMFAFLPIRSIHSLALNGCNLTSIPLAITQCCHLNSLSLANNHFHKRDSMPVEVLALISKIKHFDFSLNPLVEMPYGLFLLSTDTNNSDGNGAINDEKIGITGEILHTLIELPVWLTEPCTPYLWHLHLSNSSDDLKERVALWDTERMQRDKLTHCHQLYETIMESINIYREVALNSGCEASRKLRSVVDGNLCGSRDPTNTQHCKKCKRPLRRKSHGNRVIFKNFKIDERMGPAAMTLNSPSTTFTINNDKTGLKMPAEESKQVKGETAFPVLPIGNNSFFLTTSIAINFVLLAIVVIMHSLHRFQHKNELPESTPLNSSPERQMYTTDIKI